MADLVTKSANYCHAYNSEGFLLLCEVALGEIQLMKDAKDMKVCIFTLLVNNRRSNKTSYCFFQKPKKGLNSVKGIGQNYPNSEQYEKFENMVVPCGKPKASTEKGLSLLYNE